MLVIGSRGGLELTFRPKKYGKQRRGHNVRPYGETEQNNCERHLLILMQAAVNELRVLPGRQGRKR